MTTVEVGAKYGYSLGTIMAMIISYDHWRSLPWMLIDGFLSWVYIFYYILFY